MPKLVVNTVREFLQILLHVEHWSEQRFRHLCHINTYLLYTQGSQNGSEQVEAANMKHATNAVPMTAETFLLATRKVISQTFSCT